jgi:hypothetical protein
MPCSSHQPVSLPTARMARSCWAGPRVGLAAARRSRHSYRPRTAGGSCCSLRAKREWGYSRSTSRPPRSAHHSAGTSPELTTTLATQQPPRCDDRWNPPAATGGQFSAGADTGEEDACAKQVVVRTAVYLPPHQFDPAPSICSSDLRAWQAAVRLHSPVRLAAGGPQPPGAATTPPAHRQPLRQPTRDRTSSESGVIRKWADPIFDGR